MIRTAFIAIERWAFDEDSALLSLLKMMLVVGLLFALIAAPFVLLASHAEDTEQTRCLESGRGWAIVGHHTGYRPMLVGKVTVMQPYTATDYGCVEVVR